jgi:Gluconate 2-dehydrogenase subunit 3
MDRRDVLRLLTSAAVLPALSPDAVAFFQSAHSQIARAPGLKTLNPHQNATVTMIAELIIPETDTAGAKAAKVNEFIDLILTDWYDDATTSHFLAGLSDVDRRSQELFSKKFVACKASQQNELLHALDAEALAAPREEHAPGSPVLARMNFFAMIKKLTLIGYFTSEPGFKNELHRTIIPASHAGCAPLPGRA